MAGNDLLTRGVKTPFGTDWVYLVDQAGNIEGRVAVTDLLALGPGENNTVSNVGSGAQISKAKIAEDFPFRTLVSEDSSVVITQNTDEVDLKAVRVGVYRNIYIAAGAMVAQFTDGATSGTFETAGANNVMNDYYEFASGVDSYVQFSMAMPDEWDTTTNVGYKFYWTNGAVTGAGRVVWSLSVNPLGDGTSIDFSFPFPSETADVFQGTELMHITSPLIVSVPNTPELENLLYFRIGRNGTNGLDDYTQASRLLGVAIQYKELTTEPVAWT